MTSLLAQQQKLLAEKLQVLQRLEDGLAWSLDHLPELEAAALDDPAVAERVAAIVDRFCKLQDQLAGAMRHVHSMLGEKQRSFHDVVTWAVSEQILPGESLWLELRSLRNRLTHEYDPKSEAFLELVAMIRAYSRHLGLASARLARLCEQRGLLPAAARPA